MAVVNEVKQIVADVLQIGNDTLDSDTALLGGIAEFDSMAVVTVITSLEDHYGICVDDDEVDAETFETISSLADFISKKLES